MGRSSEEEREIVIVGGGICGLATALALHRKGIRSVVLERSETLRASGAGIAILANGWRALEQLGVASHLRQTALPIERSQDVGFGKVIPWVTGEARCLKRSDLIGTLADALPPGTIHLGRQIVSVKLDPSNSYPILQLLDGSSIVAKILIGCDGANSVVANFLELKPTTEFGLCSARGLTNYPNGHAFAHEVVRMRRNDILMGRAPIDDKSVYWFTALQLTREDHAKVSHHPERIRELILHSFNGFPAELVQIIKDSELESLSLTHLRYRAPWDLVLGKFRKGTVTVAGDAMHVMGPFLGQGGSAGLEDAIVLARCLSQKFAKTVDNPFTIESKTMTRMMMHGVGKAMDQYLKERRMRVVLLSTQTYLIGSLVKPSSLLVKFACIIVMVLLFSNPTNHTRYDCGLL
ncbi:monooxygenase 1-like isoform X2 [Rhododendron vialii]|nr:monooxygenase 1-like isoform X2 [Rhododendron vialii]